MDGGWNWSGTGGKVYGNVVEVIGQNTKILSRRERPHVVLGADNQPVALTTGASTWKPRLLEGKLSNLFPARVHHDAGVTEAWPCTTRRTPDRPPCQGFNPFAGKNPVNCGVGSNNTILWCPIDYCYTLLQPFASARGQ